MRNGSGNDTALTARNTGSDPPEWWLSHAGHPAPERRNIQEKLKVAVRLRKNIEEQIKAGVVFYGAGGALGFDTIAAQTVLEMKNEYPQLRLILVLPC